MEKNNWYNELTNLQLHLQLFQRRLELFHKNITTIKNELKQIKKRNNLYYNT